MLYANLSQVCGHKMEHKREQKLDLVQKVPCLVAYIKNRETFIPIKFGITKKQAKKTKYQYAEITASEMGEETLWVKMWGIPAALKEVCQVWECNGIEEDDT